MSSSSDGNSSASNSSDSDGGDTNSSRSNPADGNPKATGGGKSAVIIGLALLLTAAIFFRFGDSDRNDSRSGDATPSFLFVAVDTLRADHLPFYGYRRATAPQLDRFSSRGVVFENAYSAAPWTLPSFASVVTGQYPTVHRAAHLLLPESGGGEILYRGLLGSAPTLPRLMQENGYQTALVSANAHLTPQFGFEEGFAHFDYEADRSAEATTDAALEWLRTIGNAPFFGFIHYNDPHAPFVRHPEFPFEAPLPGGNPKEWSLLPSDLRPDLYDSEIAYTDHHIGRLLDQLDRWGRLDNTYVVFFSDHGEELGDHGQQGHGHSLYQELIHVPLVIFGPQVEGGRRVSTPVSLVDLFPTVVQLAGLTAQAPKTPGLHLLGELPEERALFAEGVNLEQTNLERSREQKSVLEGFQKLIYVPVTDDATWYDLRRDPHELDPQKSLRSDTVRSLLSTLARHINQPTTDTYSGTVALTPAIAKDLSSLGYLRSSGSQRIVDIQDPALAAGMVVTGDDASKPMLIRASELRPKGLVLKNDLLVKQRGAPGYTSGPYRRLYPGRYEAKIRLLRTRGRGALGSVRIASGGGAVEFIRKPLDHTLLPDDEWTTVTLPFEVPADTQIEVVFELAEAVELSIGDTEVHHVAR